MEREREEIGRNKVYFPYFYEINLHSVDLLRFIKSVYHKYPLNYVHIAFQDPKIFFFFFVVAPQ